MSRSGHRTRGPQLGGEGRVRSGLVGLGKEGRGRRGVGMAEQDRRNKMIGHVAHGKKQQKAPHMNQ